MQSVFAERLFDRLNEEQRLQFSDKKKARHVKRSARYMLRQSSLKVDTEVLELPLLSEGLFSAKKVASTKNSQGSLVWKGRFVSAGAASDALTSDSVILILRAEGITGTIRRGGKLFKIQPLNNGVHEIIEVNESNMPDDHPPEYDELQHDASALWSSSSAQQDMAAADGQVTIGVVVAYTRNAKNSVSDIQGLIELAIEETNQGYLNSGIDAQLSLVHSYETNYSGVSFGTDLGRFRDTNDGYMDEVHDLRDQHGGDIAMLITNVSDYCGMAYINASSERAFGVVYQSCATGYYSFGHEIGHLMAARHDPDTDSNTTPYAFGHGYQYPAGDWRTIMAYNCAGGCARINWWSNPYNTRGGAPMGTTSVSHNARVLNLTAPGIAGFKDGGESNVLANNVPVSNLAGNRGSEEHFYMDVPEGARDLRFDISGGSGDADLYVRYGDEPTTNSYECRPYIGGNNETCEISNVRTGQYYVMLRAYSSYANVSLVGRYDEAPEGGSFSRRNISGSKGSWTDYTIEIPGGVARLQVNMSGGSGDGDLYVRQGSYPTTSVYDCRPYAGGNVETCTMNNPEAGTWYLSVRGYSSYSGVSLDATWE